MLVPITVRMRTTLIKNIKFPGKILGDSAISFATFLTATGSVVVAIQQVSVAKMRKGQEAVEKIKKKCGEKKLTLFFSHNIRPAIPPAKINVPKK